MRCSCFFFNDTATTEIYTLSLHDALPICDRRLFLDQEPLRFEQHVHALGEVRLRSGLVDELVIAFICEAGRVERRVDRKSTRLNSSHANISYAVFCLKKKKIVQFSRILSV